MNKLDNYSVMKKVLLVSKIAPLYRKELFIYLLSNNQLEFHLALGRGEPNGIRQIKEISFKYDNVFWGNTIAYRPERTLWQTGVIKALINSEYDAIILEGGLLQIPSWIFGLLARLIGIKVFLWSHGLRGVESKFLIAAKRFMTHLLDANWLVYGEYQRKVMIRCGFKKTKVSVVYNSIGEIVMHKSNMKERQSIDVSFLPVGAYILFLKSRTKIASFRLLKNVSSK